MRGKAKMGQGIILEAKEPRFKPWLKILNLVVAFTFLLQTTNVGYLFAQSSGSGSASTEEASSGSSEGGYDDIYFDDYAGIVYDSQTGEAYSYDGEYMGDGFGDFFYGGSSGDYDSGGSDDYGWGYDYDMGYDDYYGDDYYGGYDDIFFDDELGITGYYDPETGATDYYTYEGAELEDGLGDLLYEDYYTDPTLYAYDTTGWGMEYAATPLAPDNAVTFVSTGMDDALYEDFDPEAIGSVTGEPADSYWDAGGAWVNDDFSGIPGFEDVAPAAADIAAAATEPTWAQTQEYEQRLDTLENYYQADQFVIDEFKSMASPTDSVVDMEIALNTVVRAAEEGALPPLGKTRADYANDAILDRLEDLQEANEVDQSTIDDYNALVAATIHPDMAYNNVMDGVGLASDTMAEYADYVPDPDSEIWEDFAPMPGADELAGIEPAAKEPAKIGLDELTDVDFELADFAYEFGMPLEDLGYTPEAAAELDDAIWGGGGDLAAEPAADIATQYEPGATNVPLPPEPAESALATDVFGNPLVDPYAMSDEDLVHAGIEAHRAGASGDAPYGDFGQEPVPPVVADAGPGFGIDDFRGLQEEGLPPRPAAAEPVEVGPEVLQGVPDWPEFDIEDPRWDAPVEPAAIGPADDAIGEAKGVPGIDPTEPAIFFDPRDDTSFDTAMAQEESDRMRNRYSGPDGIANAEVDGGAGLAEAVAGAQGGRYDRFVVRDNETGTLYPGLRTTRPDGTSDWTLHNPDGGAPLTNGDAAVSGDDLSVRYRFGDGWTQEWQDATRDSIDHKLASGDPDNREATGLLIPDEPVAPAAAAVAPVAPAAVGAGPDSLEELLGRARGYYGQADNNSQGIDLAGDALDQEIKDQAISKVGGDIGDKTFRNSPALNMNDVGERPLADALLDWADGVSVEPAAPEAGIIPRAGADDDALELGGIDEDATEFSPEEIGPPEVDADMWDDDIFGEDFDQMLEGFDAGANAAAPAEDALATDVFGNPIGDPHVTSPEELDHAMGEVLGQGDPVDDLPGADVDPAEDFFNPPSEPEDEVLSPSDLGMPEGGALGGAGLDGGRGLWNAFNDLTPNLPAPADDPQEAPTGELNLFDIGADDNAAKGGATLPQGFPQDFEAAAPAGARIPAPRIPTDLLGPQVNTGKPDFPTAPGPGVSEYVDPATGTVVQPVIDLNAVGAPVGTTVFNPFFDTRPAREPFDPVAYDKVRRQRTEDIIVERATKRLAEMGDTMGDVMKTERGPAFQDQATLLSEAIRHQTDTGGGLYSDDERFAVKTFDDKMNDAIAVELALVKQSARDLPAGDDPAEAADELRRRVKAGADRIFGRETDEFLDTRQYRFNAGGDPTIEPDSGYANAPKWQNDLREELHEQVSKLAFQTDNWEDRLTEHIGSIPFPPETGGRLPGRIESPSIQGYSKPGDIVEGSVGSVLRDVIIDVRAERADEAKRYIQVKDSEINKTVSAITGSIMDNTPFQDLNDFDRTHNYNNLFPRGKQDRWEDALDTSDRIIAPDEPRVDPEPARGGFRSRSAGAYGPGAVDDAAAQVNDGRASNRLPDKWGVPNQYSYTTASGGTGVADLYYINRMIDKLKYQAPDEYADLQRKYQDPALSSTLPASTQAKLGISADPSKMSMGEYNSLTLDDEFLHDLGRRYHNEFITEDGKYDAPYVW